MKNAGKLEVASNGDNEIVMTRTFAARRHLVFDAWTRPELFVPVLLLLGNKQLGVSGSLRAICAAIAPGRVEFFRYDWKRSGLWNVAFAFGLIGGGFVMAVLGVRTPEISAATQATLGKLDLLPASGLIPWQVFSWHSLLTLRGAACMVGGGFLVGFGASYAGGCTSGHGIMGLATRQRASLVALLGIFAGGLIATFIILPVIL